MKRFAGMALALLAAGCLSEAGFSFTQDFDFDVSGENWVAGVADVPAAQAGAVGLLGDRRPLPAPLNTAKNALYLSGTNVSGDLFLFQKRRFTGFAANTDFKISVAIEIVSNYNAGCTSGPGPVTFIKGGVSDLEPLAAADGQGVLRMNIDKGAGAAPGEFVQFGDIRNSATGCPTPAVFSNKGTTVKFQTARVLTDAVGGFWLWFGTQSSFAGSHEIYVTGMRVVLE